MKLTATFILKGDTSRLTEYRAYVNHLLDGEQDVSYAELHSASELEYRLKPRGGIPFPPFVMTSQAFPELSVEVAWHDADAGDSGRALIQNGVLREQGEYRRAPEGPLLREVRAGTDGELRIGIACARWRDAWHGYVITSQQHAFFRAVGTAESCELRASDGVEPEWAERWEISSAGGRYFELAPREAIDSDELRELDRVARDFSAEWIWFDESPPEETAVERQRFATYAYPVRAANLRSEALRKVLRPENGGLALSSFGKEHHWIAQLLQGWWLRAGA